MSYILYQTLKKERKHMLVFVISNMTLYLEHDSYWNKGYDSMWFVNENEVTCFFCNLCVFLSKHAFYLEKHLRPLWKGGD